MIEILLARIIFLDKSGRPFYFKQYGQIIGREKEDLVPGIISALLCASKEIEGENVKQIIFENRTLYFKEEDNVLVAVSTVYPLDESDVQALLYELLRGFIDRYRGIIENWDGNMAEFADVDEVVEPIVQKFEQKYDQFRKRCAMILTLGATPDPLKKTINNFKPEYVCFLTTKDMIIQLADVLEGTGAKEERYKYNYYQIEDEYNISHCLKVSEQAFDELFKKGYSAQDIYVDITGGTKVMAVGLGIGAVKYHTNIVYVGVKHDTQGRPIIGTEDIYFAYNPQEFFASKQVERGLELFNDYRWRAAIEAFKEAYENFSEGVEKKLASIFRALTIAYESWDRFRYRTAVLVLDKVCRAVHVLCDIRSTDALEKLCKHVEINLGALTILDSMEKIKGPAPPAIVDMFSNALRRAKELNFDDAVTRIHRLTEMLVQYKLLEDYKIETTDVDPNKIPDKKLAEILSQKKDQKGKIKLDLRESYNLLNSLDPKPQKINLRNELLNYIQQVRNHSILAHGVSTTPTESFERLKELTENLLKEEIPHFENIIQDLQFPRLHENLRAYLRKNE